MTIAAPRPVGQPAAAPAAIGALAVACLREELAAYPKPGLVSRIDAGSHADMDAGLLEASIAALAPYFAAIAAAGAAGLPMTALRRLGLDAEAAMMRATGGVNTHRGAIFGLGLLCAAAGARAALGEREETLGRIVARRWGDAIARGPALADSHGTRVRLEHGAGGARDEAAAGFPSLYAVGLPALRRALARRPDDADAPCVAVLFALLAETRDTNLLYRGGAEGLAFAQKGARDFLAAGGIAAPDWRLRAERLHRAFVARRLSPGGCADLLAMTLFVARHDKIR